MAYLLAAIAIFVAYLSGSLPVGYLVARLYGVDVTAHGSGRIGGTNVLRAAGPIAAGLTVIGDVFKGLTPVYLLSAANAPPLIIALAGAAAVLGHNYSIFLGFRGGVGAGAAVGALGGLNFWAGLIAAACGLVGLSLTGYASILSTSIAVSSLVLMIIFALLGYTPYPYIIFGLLTMVIMLNALRPNFARLRAGTERRVGSKRKNIVNAS